MAGQSRRVACAFNVAAAEKLTRRDFSGFGGDRCGPVVATSPDGETLVVLSGVDGPVPALVVPSGKRLRNAVPAGWSHVIIEVRLDVECQPHCID